MGAAKAMVKIIRLNGLGIFTLVGCMIFFSALFFDAPVLLAQTRGPEPESAGQPVTGGNMQPASETISRQIGKKFRPGGPLTTFITQNFVGSSRCAACHDLLVDKAGNDMSISNHWRSTMMANASKDPFWQAKVNSEVARNPALTEVIEGKCSLCHMPMAWVQAYQQGIPRKILGDQGFLDHNAELYEPARDGVSCSLCHQIQDKKLGEKESFSGKFTIDTAIPAPDRKIFGPYQEPITKPMRTSVEFTPEYGAHINDSALCATCHTLFTPYVDATGKVAGEFPEQTPYLEWRHSDYGVSADLRYDIGENKGTGLICQECHMPHSEAGGVKIAKWAPPEIKERDHFSQHHFVGGNVFMLKVLQDNIANLSLTASAEKIEDTMMRTRRQLQEASAQLSFLTARRSGDELTATLLIDNKVGHKFPTGFPSRNLWIHLTILDGNEQIVFESGKPLADGRIAGNDADEQRLAYEPHYDVITAPEQVQIYEAVMGNTDGEVTYTLLRAARYLKDNRLLPRGFDKAVASDDIGVYGKAVEDDTFTGGSDKITYKVKTQNRPGPFAVQAELLYTAISYNFMDDLSRDDQLSKVRRFGRYYAQADKTPVVVAAARQDVR